jgi:hypothetical protein
VIALFFDGLTAVVKTLDRLLTAADGARLQSTPRTVEDARPAGAGPRPGPGGHPIRSTSELLGEAAGQLVWVYEDRAPAVVRELMDDLIDRAAELAAVGD